MNISSGSLSDKSIEKKQRKLLNQKHQIFKEELLFSQKYEKLYVYICKRNCEWRNTTKNNKL